MDYKPPFTMTDKITNLVIEIGELTGRFSEIRALSKNPKLRKVNRIQSIYSSLAIEQNTLTLDQVTDIINGKRILAPPKDIHEVKNAYEAYEKMAQLDANKIEDMLLGHKIMMSDLVKESGVFRSAGVGVFAGDTLIHAAPQAKLVPELMQELFTWLNESSMHPLIKSCVFHYEFEFIHPFSDGNGRMGRMWQTLILAKWKEYFLWLPVENMIYEKQEEYYNAINESTKQGESTYFIEFMLETIKDAMLELQVTNQVTNQATNQATSDFLKEKNLNSIEKQIIEVIIQNPTLSQKKIAIMLDEKYSKVKFYMEELKKKKIIYREGSSQKGKWVINVK